MLFLVLKPALSASTSESFRPFFVANDFRRRKPIYNRNQQIHDQNRKTDPSRRVIPKAECHRKDTAPYSKNRLPHRRESTRRIIGNHEDSAENDGPCKQMIEHELEIKSGFQKRYGGARRKVQQRNLRIDDAAENQIQQGNQNGKYDWEINRSGKNKKN